MIITMYLDGNGYPIIEHSKESLGVSDELDIIIMMYVNCTLYICLFFVYSTSLFWSDVCMALDRRRQVLSAAAIHRQAVSAGA